MERPLVKTRHALIGIYKPWKKVQATDAGGGRVPSTFLRPSGCDPVYDHRLKALLGSFFGLDGTNLMTG